MAAATADRTTKRREGRRVSDPVAASTALYAGTMYAIHGTTGYAVAAGASGAGPARAIVMGRADNTDGAAGAIRVEGERGIGCFANSADADEIERTHIGELCYVVDNQTVALTDNSGARAVAGQIVDVDATGVWVDVGSHPTPPEVEA